jgi:hypothetical protein
MALSLRSSGLRLLVVSGTSDARDAFSTYLNFAFDRRDGLRAFLNVEPAFEPRSAEINARESIYKAVNISKGLFPHLIVTAAGILQFRKVRASGPTLLGKRRLTIKAAQAGSAVLGPASIIFKDAS